METFRRPTAQKTFDYTPDIPQNIVDVVQGKSESVAGNRLLQAAAQAQAASATASQDAELMATAEQVESDLEDMHSAKVVCEVQNGAEFVVHFRVMADLSDLEFARLAWDTAVLHACQAAADQLAIKLGVPHSHLRVQIEQSEPTVHDNSSPETPTTARTATGDGNSVDVATWS